MRYLHKITTEYRDDKSKKQVDNILDNGVVSSRALFWEDGKTYRWIKTFYEDSGLLKAVLYYDKNGNKTELQLYDVNGILKDEIKY